MVRRRANSTAISYAVEIKAVNNRYLKTIIKLPEGTAFLEDDIDKELRRQLSRGTINYVLRVKSVSANALFEIDEAALRSLVMKLNEISASVGVKGPSTWRACWSCRGSFSR